MLIRPRPKATKTSSCTRCPATSQRRQYNNRGDGDKDAGYYKAAKNASELNAIFDEIQKSETTTSAYTNVVMEDTLSEYVDLDDNTYKVVAKDASGQDVALTPGTDYNLTYDSASLKKFVVTFLKPLANSVTYTLEYNVKPTQKAYDEYAANLNASKDGYDGVSVTRALICRETSRPRASLVSTERFRMPVIHGRECESSV